LDSDVEKSRLFAGLLLPGLSILTSLSLSGDVVPGGAFLLLLGFSKAFFRC